MHAQRPTGLEPAFGWGHVFADWNWSPVMSTLQGFGHSVTEALTVTDQFTGFPLAGGKGDGESQVGQWLILLDGVEGVRNTGLSGGFPYSLPREKMQVEIWPGRHEGIKGRDGVGQFSGVIGDADEDGKRVERPVTIVGETQWSFPARNLEGSLFIITVEVL